MDTNMNMNVELYEKLRRLQWLLHKQHLKSHAGDGPRADASRGQGRILAFLRMKDGISTKDMSYLLGIRVSSLNELLSKLEKREYITRTPSEADKRVMLVYLTEKGKAQKDQENEKTQQEGSNVFACLSTEEQANFGIYLDRVITSLEAEVGTEEERSEMAEWMEAAKERMGAAQFEELMSMRGKMHHKMSGSEEGHFQGGFPGFGRGRHGEGMHHGFGHSSRGRRNASSHHPEEQEDSK